MVPSGANTSEQVVRGWRRYCAYRIFWEMDVSFVDVFSLVYSTWRAQLA